MNIFENPRFIEKIFLKSKNFHYLLYIYIIFIYDKFNGYYL